MADLIFLGLRSIFIISLPFLAAVTVASVLIGALESATSIHEPALGYAARVAAFVVALYWLFPAISETLQTLFTTALLHS